MKRIIRAFAPALLIGGIFLCIPLLPEGSQMNPAAMTEVLPLNYELEGWYGERRQESERERAWLAKDTRFSKADYTLRRQSIFDKVLPPVHVSLVFSGSDINNSIHRPERCLPSQGHINLKSSTQSFRLDDGREITLTRLGSELPHADLPDKKLNFIHYYIFVGSDAITHTHIQRTLLDMRDRILMGKTQKWAYFQAGTYWSPHLDVSEQEADAVLSKLMCQLLPRIIKWEEIKG